MIARMQIRETAWDQLLADYQTCVDTLTCSLPPEVQKLLRNGQAREIDANNPVGFIMVDAIGAESELDALYNYFAPADRQAYWKWEFSGKVDFETEYTGQHNDILATEPDDVTYDQNGNPTGSTPATFEDPNWVHGWVGQGDSEYRQRHARSVTRGFGEGFS